MAHPGRREFLGAAAALTLGRPVRAAERKAPDWKLVTDKPGWRAQAAIRRPGQARFDKPQTLSPPGPTRGRWQVRPWLVDHVSQYLMTDVVWNGGIGETRKIANMAEAFGVPMILLGIMAPLLGPMLGMGEHRGKCPFCGTRMISVDDGKAHEQ